jgi:hypothetical protein
MNAICSGGYRQIDPVVHKKSRMVILTEIPDSFGGLQNLLVRSGLFSKLHRRDSTQQCGFDRFEKIATDILRPDDEIQLELIAEVALAHDRAPTSPSSGLLAEA